MKALLLIFSLVVIGVCGVHWKKIEDLKESLADYNQSAEKIARFVQETLLDSKLKAAEFVNQHSSSYLLTTLSLNETECYQSRFNPTQIQRSFQSEIIRSQLPLENLLVELRGKLDDINNTITMHQDLADGKYSICKVLNGNANCQEETDLWLEGIASLVRCQIYPNCRNHVIAKRSAAQDCSIGMFVCDSGKCISPRNVCDGNSNCDDKSDESNCCNDGIRCSPYECIHRDYICDGKQNCEDGMDELHCGTINMKTCTIENGGHNCDSIRCLGLDQVCNGISDCTDGSDEGHLCGIGLCPEECTKKGGVCFHGPRGPQCLTYCPLGTFESPEGCVTHTQPTNRTVIELLEEIPKLNYKLNVKFTYLKMKAIATVSEMMIGVFKCLDPHYPELARVHSFPTDNQTYIESYIPKSSTITLDVTTETTSEIP